MHTGIKEKKEKYMEKYEGKFHYTPEDIRELFGYCIPDCLEKIMEAEDHE